MIIAIFLNYISILFLFVHISLSASMLMIYTPHPPPTIRRFDFNVPRIFLLLIYHAHNLPSNDTVFSRLCSRIAFFLFIIPHKWPTPFTCISIMNVRTLMFTSFFLHTIASTSKSLTLTLALRFTRFNPPLFKCLISSPCPRIADRFLLWTSPSPLLFYSVFPKCNPNADFLWTKEMLCLWDLDLCLCAERAGPDSVK